MCDLDDFEGQELSRGWHQARKVHKCIACGEAIHVGDHYHSVQHLQDGEFTVFKHCARCWHICEALWDAGAEAVQWDLNCGETWDDNFGELPPEIAELAFITRAEAQARAAASK